MQSLSVQQAFLLDRATSIWARRGAAKRTGLHFNEETVTELLLLDLECSFPGDVTIVPFHKNLEAVVGADWAWAFVDSDGVSCQAMLVQAKRLDDGDKRYRELRHKQGRPKHGSAASQMDKLIDTGKRLNLPPVYAFYNHLDDHSRLVNKCGSILSSAPAHAGSWGVTLASAFAVRDAMPDNTFDCHRHHSRPLHCLLCTRGTGAHTQTGLAQAASFALTMLFSDGLPHDEVEPDLRAPFRPLTGLPEIFLRAQGARDREFSAEDALRDGLRDEYAGIAGVVIIRDRPAG